MAIKRIIEIYKELKDVVIYEDDNGSIGIRSMLEDKGTEEERKVIAEMVGGPGFKVNNSATISITPPETAAPALPINPTP